MVGHQAPRKDVDLMEADLLPQMAQVEAPIVIGEEDVHAANPSLYYVVSKSRDHDPCDTWHTTS
jgi:hypothetical protein